MGKILEVKNLTVHIKTHKGIVQAVRGVDFYLNEQETLAVVGESGSGKSITMKGVLWGYRKKEELLKNGADYLVDSPEDILDLYEEKCEE